MFLFMELTVKTVDLKKIISYSVAPPEGLRAPELPGVNPGDRPQKSGGDSKAI